MRMGSFRPVVLILLVAVVLTGTATVAVAAPPAGKAGRFIVTLAGGVNPAAVADEYRTRGAAIDYVYTAAVQGFAGAMSEAAVNGLLRDSRVRRVEKDGVAAASAVQSSPPWGLDRTDQRSLPLSKSYTYTTTGAGVHAYIIDTGIRQTHTEFKGRIGKGYDALSSGGSASDCNGHGTHVAGTVGGTTYGMAKGVTLYPVRVLNCNGSGSWSGVIAGIDWVTKNHAKPAVANMSLGGSANATVDDAVRRSISAGVSYAVAAGNEGKDACTTSPARVGEAMTVAATDSRDSRTSWSNYGSCVNIFAPGASITSAWYDTDTSSKTISGTSMASPHVAGAMARYLQANPGSSPSQVLGALTSLATTGKVSSAGSGSPNRLLYIEDGTSDGGDTSPSPSPTPVTLEASTTKVKGSRTVNLSWAGATSTSVDVWRNGTRITTTANDGAHADSLGKGGGSYTYRVCEAGTSTCSNEVIVS